MSEQDLDLRKEENVNKEETHRHTNKKRERISKSQSPKTDDKCDVQYKCKWWDGMWEVYIPQISKIVQWAVLHAENKKKMWCI